MWVHFLIIVLLIGIIGLQKITLPNSTNNRILFWGTFLLFFIFVAFRDYSIGNDTQEYYRIFKLIGEQPSFFKAITATRYEVGYLTLNFLVTRFTSNYTWMLCIVAAFYLYSSLRLVKRYSESPALSIVMMFALSLFYLVINIQRQCIAMAIFYFAIPFLIQRKKIIYSLLILLATSFHSAAIILIALAFTPRILFSDKKSVRMYLSLAVAALIFMNFGLGFILSFFPYFQHYFTNSVYSQGGIRTASIAFFGVRFFILLLTFFIGGLKYRDERDRETIAVFDKIVFIDVFIAAASIGFNMFDRLESFFTLGYIIAISNGVNALLKSDKSFQSNRKVAILFILVLTVGYMTSTLLFRGSWTGIFPYSFRF